MACFRLIVCFLGAALTVAPIQSALAVADVGNVRFVHPSIDPNFGGTQPSYRSLTHSAAGWQFNGEGKIGWVGKPAATVSANRTLDFAKAGKFLGKKARLLGPLGWVALAFSGIGWVWDYAGGQGWLKPLSAETGYPAGWYCAASWGCSGWSVGSSPEQICAAYPAQFNQWPPYTGFVMRTINSTTWQCGGRRDGVADFSTIQVNIVRTCPAGQTGTAVGCAVPAMAPATEPEMDTALESLARSNPAATAWAWAPGDPVPTEADRPVVTGPASVVGPETVTTTQSPSGTTTKRQTKTADLSYLGDTVKADIRTTTVTTNPDGSVKTETETEGSDEEAKPSETTDFCQDHPTASACLPRWCEDHPNSLECQDVTQSVTLPDVDLAGQEVTGSWSSEWHEAGACPADLSTYAFGRQIVWEMGPYCDFASALRPVVIAVSALSAALWFFQATRST